MSQPRILLHIGMTKAGSSALQQALLLSRDALAARGVLYPRNPPGIGYINHKLLLAALFDWRGSRTMHLPPEQRPPSLEPASDAFLADLRATIAATAPRCVILSTESLFRTLPEPGPARLPELLADLGGPSTVVAYLRRPSEHYLSRLQQQLKASYEAPKPGARRYRAVLESYEAMFGADALALRLYHRPALVGGDIVADFTAKHLAPYGVERAALAVPDQTNDTISAESIDISRRFRLAFHRDRDNRFTSDSRRLVAALRAADARTGAPRPRLRPGIADGVDYACVDALWLRDRHGIVFPEFDYGRVKAGAPAAHAPAALADIIEIDRRLERAILADLRAAPWAAEPGRRGWIDALLADLA